MPVESMLIRGLNEAFLFAYSHIIVRRIIGNSLFCRRKTQVFHINPNKTTNKTPRINEKIVL